MAFVDLCVNVNQEDPRDLAQLAERLGFDSICLVKGWKPGLKWRDEITKIRNESRVNLVSGLAISAENVGQLVKEVKAARKNAEVIIVRGGDYIVNRAACENYDVDVLLHPEHNRADMGLDEYCFQSAANNKIAIGISFHRILESVKKSRAHKLSHIATILRVAKKYKTPVVVVSDAFSKWEMRAPRELAAVASVLGTTIEEAVKMVSDMPQIIISENRKKIQDG